MSNIQCWIATLVLIGLIHLLPWWLIGFGSLGAALGLWIAYRVQHKRQVRREAEELHRTFLRNHPQIAEWQKKVSGENIVPLRRR